MVYNGGISSLFLFYYVSNIIYLIQFAFSRKFCSRFLIDPSLLFLPEVIIRLVMRRYLFNSHYLDVLLPKLFSKQKDHAFIDFSLPCFLLFTLNT